MSLPTLSSQINGARKAAILMALLGEDAAAAVYKNLPPDDVQAITEELASLDRVTPEAAKQILEEYSQLVLTQDYLVEGGAEYATRLLVRAFGNEVAQDLLGRVARAQEMEGGKLGALQKATPSS